jgi:hypothetical protein
MIRLRHTLHIALGLTILGMSAVFLTSSPAMSQNQNMEVIHHPKATCSDRRVGNTGGAMRFAYCTPTKGARQGRAARSILPSMVPAKGNETTPTSKRRVLSWSLQPSHSICANGMFAR